MGNEEGKKLNRQQAKWRAPEQPSKNVVAAERFKFPFFVREATLEQTLGRLKEIEPSKRKIIVYVGFHPNEGTDVLTRRHADVWAEKFGATVVCQPTEETPHAIWAKNKPKSPDGVIQQLPPDVILDSEDYAEKFSLDDKDTFIISLHGTPLRLYNDNNRSKGRPERARGLLIETSRYNNHPEDFKNRRHPIEFSKPDIVAGLERVMPSTEQGGVKNEVKEEEFQDDERWYPGAPNTLLIEYFYEGKPVKIEDPYILKLLGKEEKDYSKIGDGYPANLPNVQLGLFSNQNWDRQMCIGPSYLNQDVLTDEDVKVFDDLLVKDVEKILEFISSRLSAGQKDDPAK